MEHHWNMVNDAYELRRSIDLTVISGRWSGSFLNRLYTNLRAESRYLKPKTAAKIQHRLR
jgi:hypothetical protein